MLSINFAMYYPTLYLNRAVILHDTFNNAMKMLTIRSALCYGMFRTCLAHIATEIDALSTASRIHSRFHAAPCSARKDTSTTTTTCPRTLRTTEPKAFGRTYLGANTVLYLRRISRLRILHDVTPHNYKVGMHTPGRGAGLPFVLRVTRGWRVKRGRECTCCKIASGSY